MKTKRSQYTLILSKYLPGEFIEDVVELLIAYPVIFKITKPRKTKQGDFRAGLKNEKHQITVNGNLNRYAFLITTLHEFAHLITYNEYGRRVAPHGKEWKDQYARLILPVIQSKKLPADVEKVLLNSLVNVKASSCSDLHLQRTLLKYDKSCNDNVPLESLDKNCIFALNGKTFKKGILRRTRFLCTEENSKRQYLVNALAQVKEIKHEE